MPIARPPNRPTTRQSTTRQSTTRLTAATLFDAAELRRTSRAANTPADLAELLREILAEARNRLVEYHLEGGRAATLVKQHSNLLDHLLCHAWQCLAQSHSGLQRLALVAVGGYGRAELNLASDVDLLLLLPAARSPALAQDAAAFIRLCWDMQLKPSHNTASPKHCIDLAKTDVVMMTTLMEARFLAGDGALFANFCQQLKNPRLWPAERYFKSKLAEQTARHLEFSDTAYNLEPNLKESPGGLRDLHTISWVAKRHFGTADWNELVQHEFLRVSELQQLIKARNFLWRLRNGLHILSNRNEDRLLFDYQTDLASQLGYQKSKNHLAVEQMMQRYYRSVKELQLLNELLLQHFAEVILSGKKPRVKAINRRFQAVGQFIESVDPHVFTRVPSARLELFYILQRNPKLKGVRASTVRQLRASLPSIDHAYRQHPEHRQLFLQMFQHQHGLTRALRRMNAYGVLGRFFPEFGQIVGQMQHDLFHVYTVDAHSLFVVGNLRRLMRPQHRLEFPLLSDLISRQNKRERLYLAALCHDLGKGSGRDHSTVGEAIAYALCQRLEMSEYDAAFVAWLVRHHLTMSWTAQREDISDPRVIDRFAAVVGDQERLDNLYLLTFADIRGTSAKVWNEWKGRLLADLYAATAKRLRSGISGAQAVQQRISARQQEIKKLLKGRLTEPAIDQFWSILDAEYFLRNAPETSAWHTLQVSRAGLLEVPLVAARYRAEIKAQQILVMAAESETLLLSITGGLERLNLNIMDARIHQTKVGLALLVFIAADPQALGANKKWLKHNTQTLRTLLLAKPDEYQPSERILPRAVKQFRVATEVTFSQAHAQNYTVMDVIARDRPGLLYHVARAISECKVKLISAKVSTVGEKAEDTFFITDRDGHPVISVDQQAQLETCLKTYLV